MNIHVVHPDEERIVVVFTDIGIEEAFYFFVDDKGPHVRIFDIHIADQTVIESIPTTFPAEEIAHVGIGVETSSLDLLHFQSF